jgi:homoserine kinase
MDKPDSVTVHVPASAANLGPGFDCLGLALDIWNEVSFRIVGSGVSITIEGEGVEELPIDYSNLILRTAMRLYEKEGRPFPPGIEIECHNQIPVSSGLGSSSAAVIAGLLGAKMLLNSMIPDEDLLALAVEFEGHADNVAACLLGGLVIALSSQNGWIAEKIPIQPLHLVVVQPQVNLSTRQARAALPQMVSYHDAVSNLGNTALLVHALREGRKDLLNTAMQDNLHQPYRLKLIPGAEEVIQAAYNAGAYGAALSGAGPSLFAFGENNLDKIGKAMQAVFKARNIPSRVFLTHSTQKGAY